MNLFSPVRFLLAGILVIGSALLSLELAQLYAGQPFDEIGDYYFEVDPVLLRFLQEPGPDLYRNFFPPLMMPLPIEIRAVVIWVLFQFGVISDSTNPVIEENLFHQRYFWGSLSLIIPAFVMLFWSLWQGTFKRLGIKNVLLISASAALIAANPLLTSAIQWGHPEEILMSAAIVASGLMLLREKWAWGAVFAGIAFATKQPAFFLLPAALLFMPSGERWKFFYRSAIVAAIITIPAVVIGWQEFFEHNFLMVGGQDFNVSRGFEFWTALGIRDWAEVGKPLLFLLALILPLSAARIAQEKKSWKISHLRLLPNQFAIILPMIFLLRGTLDMGNISYYMLPAGLSFLLVDWVWQRSSGSLWRETFPRSEITIPLLTTLLSCIYGLLFYQDIFENLSDGQRGIITMQVVVPLLIIMLVRLYGWQRLKQLGQKGWLVAAAAICGVFLLMLPIHYVLDNPDPEKIYKDFKPYPRERMSYGLLSGQAAYWLGEKAGALPLTREGMPLDIIYNRNRPRGEIISSFFYARQGSPLEIRVDTYNRIPEADREFLRDCLSGRRCPDAQVIKGNKTAVLRQEKIGGSTSWGGESGTDPFNWTLFVPMPGGQMVQIENSSLPLRAENALSLVRIAAKAEQ